MDETTRLLREAADGDRVALAAWIRRSQAEVWRFVASGVGAQRADDVTQEVFLRAIRAMDRFRGESSSRTWLLSIARRTVADEHRRTYRRRRIEATVEAMRHDTVEEPVDVATQSHVGAAIEALDPDRREPFVLTQVLGLSYAEAAEVLDVPIGTVRSRIARAREDLIGELGPDAQTA